MPEGARPVESIGDATTAVVFAEDASELRAAVDRHRDALARPEILWIAYPKGNRSDINRDRIPPILAEHGMRPIGQVAVDEVWSALRFRPLRQGEAAFARGRR